MNFSSLFMLRLINQKLLLILLIPYMLNAMEMEEGNSAMHHQSHIFTNPLLIKAVAKFNTLNHGQKDFARYIAPRSLHHDLNGNVQTVDVLNISIKTDKFSPMYRVDIAPIAISLATNQMKLACTIFNEYDQAQSTTIEMMLPLDENKKFDIPLALIDETGTQVLLSIDTTTQE